MKQWINVSQRRQSLYTSMEAVKVLVAQSHLTLCNPMDCSLPDLSIHGISQARVPEWVAFLSPGDLPDPGIRPWIAGRFFTIWAMREALSGGYTEVNHRAKLILKVKIMLVWQIHSNLISLVVRIHKPSLPPFFPFFAQSSCLVLPRWR